MSKPERIALFGFVLLMLLSGFAGISYEVLYGRILGNLIGDQFAVSASVLITFLLGIGVGSLHAHRLWRFLWAIEAAIGLFGLMFAFSGSWLNTAIYALTPLFPGGLEGNLLISIILLSGPAFLIGCSVPLFSGYLSGLMPEAAFSRVYAVYNFGAFITALLIEFVMIRAFGIRGAVLCFAAINGVVALWLRVGFFRVRPKATEGVLHIEWPHWWGLVLASIASALFQLFMVKFAELVLGPFRESFALVLSLVLLGIAVGSLLVRRFRFSFTTLMLVNLVGLLWLVVAVKLGIYLYAALYGLSAHNYFYSVLLKWFFLAGLMGVPAITFGATVPAILVRERDVSRESGALLFASSMANVAGFLLMAFVLHRYLDYGVQLLVIGMVSMLAVAVYARFCPRVLAAAAVIVVSMVGVYHYRWDEDLLYLSYTNFRSLDDLREARASFDFPERFRGYQDVFSINWMHGSPFFFINGYISIPLNNPSEKVVGALSSMFAPRADDALVLGLGSGATASTVGLVFDQTNVVEINPVVRQNLYRMRRWNYDIEHNPNVDIVVDDAIHYTKSSNKRYSLILNTVTTPLYFSSSKLYTRDFLDVVHRRLRPDGVYVTWMDSRIGDRGADIILNTIRQSFRHCAILYIKSAYFLLVCSDRPISPQQAAVVAGNPTIRADLMKRYGILADWLPYQLMDTDVFSLIGDRHVPVNEMNHPSLEFEMSRLHEKGIWGFKKR
ncbi:MAG TPA: spermine synthase, partial [Mariprofundaceae bacterium]|nr:spermine synthase [Mariprofundaceae bacterium]